MLLQVWYDGKENQRIIVIQEAIKNCFLIGNGSDIYRGETKESWSATCQHEYVIVSDNTWSSLICSGLIDGDLSLGQAHPPIMCSSLDEWIARIHILSLLNIQHSHYPKPYKKESPLEITKNAYQPNGKKTKLLLEILKEITGNKNPSALAKASCKELILVMQD